MNLTVVVIALCCFIIFTILLSLKYKKSVDDSEELNENEKVLFTDDNVRVQQFGPVEDVVLNNCKVKVTNQRIIISQKIIFSSKYVLKYMIDYCGNDVNTDLSKTLKKGYLIFSINKSAISKTLNKSGKNDILIKIPEYMSGNHSLQLRTNVPEKYEKLLL